MSDATPPENDPEGLRMYREAAALVRELRENLERSATKPDHAVQYTQRTHTLNELRATSAEFRLQFVAKSLRDRIARLEAANEALRKQIGEPGALRFFGGYQRALGYPAGAVVVHAGSSWAALSAAEPGDAPGSGPPWQLLVKSART